MDSRLRLGLIALTLVRLLRSLTNEKIAKIGGGGAKFSPKFAISFEYATEVATTM